MIELLDDFKATVFFWIIVVIIQLFDFFGVKPLKESKHKVKKQHMHDFFDIEQLRVKNSKSFRIFVKVVIGQAGLWFIKKKPKFKNK
jgi:hypothetical protein